MTKRAALILAGGKAKRFQNGNVNWQDKALARLSGKPLLVHAILNVSGVVDETIICVNNEARKKQYTEVLAEYGLDNLKLVTDEKIENYGGPLLAILTGLKFTNADFCLTLPADMPLLKPQVANYLFQNAKGNNTTVPMWPNGKLENLVMILKTYEISEVIKTLFQMNRSRPLDIIRAASKVMLINIEGEIRTLDPEMRSFVNINSPQDLILLKARQTQGPVTKNIEINLGDLPIAKIKQLQEVLTKIKFDPTIVEFLSFIAKYFEESKMFFWGAISREKIGKSLLELESIGTDAKGKAALLQAAKNYSFEASIYENNQCLLLAERARADQSWCQSAATRVK
jgi:molybdenum cofactor guanylyltransferase